MDSTETDTTYSRRKVLKAGTGAAVGLTAVGASGTASAQEDPEDAYDGYLAEAEWDGDTMDMREVDDIVVEVGAGMQGLQFDPVAILVESGQTVTWEWTGEGGAHDVTNVDEEFASEMVDDAGHTFEHTFEEEGYYNYVCTPHEGLEMKGTVVVGEDNVETELVGAGEGGLDVNMSAIMGGAAAFGTIAVLGVAAYQELVGGSEGDH